MMENRKGPYTTRGRGVTVHRADCINAVNAQDQARVVPVDWDAEATHLYPVDIKIEAWDRQGLLRDITEIFSRERINVTAANTLTRNSATRMAFTLEVSNLEALSRALTLVRDVRGVLSAVRR